MNKVITRIVPASELPDSLRGDLDIGSTVKVTIEAASLEEQRAARRALLENILKPIWDRPPADDDPVARIRALRDEWDD
jgi:hypothetical protein